MPRRKTRQEISRLKLVVDEIVIAWLAMGLTTGEIACNLKRSDKAVGYRWAGIKKRFGFRCYQDATRFAMVHGLIPFKV